MVETIPATELRIAPENIRELPHAIDDEIGRFRDLQTVESTAIADGLDTVRRRIVYDLHGNDITLDSQLLGGFLTDQIPAVWAVVFSCAQDVAGVCLVENSEDILKYRIKDDALGSFSAFVSWKTEQEDGMDIHSTITHEVEYNIDDMGPADLQRYQNLRRYVLETFGTGYDETVAFLLCCVKADIGALESLLLPQCYRQRNVPEDPHFFERIQRSIGRYMVATDGLYRRSRSCEEKDKHLAHDFLDRILRDRDWQVMRLEEWDQPPNFGRMLRKNLRTVHPQKNPWLRGETDRGYLAADRLPDLVLRDTKAELLLEALLLMNEYNRQEQIRLARRILLENARFISQLRDHGDDLSEDAEEEDEQESKAARIKGLDEIAEMETHYLYRDRHPWEYQGNWGYSRSRIADLHIDDLQEHEVYIPFGDCSGLDPEATWEYTQREMAHGFELAGLDGDWFGEEELDLNDDSDDADEHHTDQDVVGSLALHQMIDRLEGISGRESTRRETYDRRIANVIEHLRSLLSSEERTREKWEIGDFQFNLTQREDESLVTRDFLAIRLLDAEKIALSPLLQESFLELLNRIRDNHDVASESRILIDSIQHLLRWETPALSVRLPGLGNQSIRSLLMQLSHDLFSDAILLHGSAGLESETPETSLPLYPLCDRPDNAEDLRKSADAARIGYMRKDLRKAAEWMVKNMKSDVYEFVMGRLRAACTQHFNGRHYQFYPFSRATSALEKYILRVMKPTEGAQIMQTDHEFPVVSELFESAYTIEIFTEENWRIRYKTIAEIIAEVREHSTDNTPLFLLSTRTRFGAAPCSKCDGSDNREQLATLITGLKMHFREQEMDTLVALDLCQSNGRTEPEDFQKLGADLYLFNGSKATHAGVGCGVLAVADRLGPAFDTIYEREERPSTTDLEATLLLAWSLEALDDRVDTITQVGNSPEHRDKSQICTMSDVYQRLTETMIEHAQNYPNRFRGTFSQHIHQWFAEHEIDVDQLCEEFRCDVISPIPGDTKNYTGIVSLAFRPVPPVGQRSADRHESDEPNAPLQPIELECYLHEEGVDTTSFAEQGIVRLSIDYIQDEADIEHIFDTVARVHSMLILENMAHYIEREKDKDTALAFSVLQSVSSSADETGVAQQFVRVLFQQDNRSDQ